jgi:hypothetical protein
MNDNTCSQGSVLIHCNKQKKHRLTKESLEKPAPMQMEAARNGLYPVTDDNYLMLLMCLDEMDFIEM